MKARPTVAGGGGRRHSARDGGSAAGRVRDDGDRMRQRRGRGAGAADRTASDLAMIYADVHLHGRHERHRPCPACPAEIIPASTWSSPQATCPLNLPHGATFMPKPWRPLDLLREAERSREH